MDLIEFKNKLIQKKDLLKCIFTTLLIQLIVTASSTHYIINNNVLINSNLLKYISWKKFWFEGLMKLIVIIIIMSILTTIIKDEEVSFKIRQLVFIIFSCILGLYLSLLIIGTKNEIVNIAIRDTFIIFITMLIIGLNTIYFNIDLEPYEFIIAIIILFIFIISLINIFLKSKKTNIFISIAIFISVLSLIVFTTNDIINKYPNDNSKCINGAYEYYLQILSIFELLLKRKNKE
tara:strand:- start:404 stop:1105 length:702 start_codon:yes stop_codon:yes gene_type:complete